MSGGEGYGSVVYFTDNLHAGVVRGGFICGGFLSTVALAGGRGCLSTGCAGWVGDSGTGHVAGGRPVEDVVKGAIVLPGVSCSGPGGSEGIFVGFPEAAADYSLSGGGDHLPRASRTASDFCVLISVLENGVDDSGGDVLVAGEIRVIVAGVGGHGVDGGGSVGSVDVVPGFPGWEGKHLVVDLRGVEPGMYMEEGVSARGVGRCGIPVVSDRADSEDWGQNVPRVEEALLDEGCQVLLEDSVGTDDLVGKVAPLLHDVGVRGEEVPLGVGFLGPQVVGGEVVPEFGFWSIGEDEEGGVVVIDLGLSHGVVMVSGAGGRGERGLAGMGNTSSAGFQV